MFSWLKSKIFGNQKAKKNNNVAANGYYSSQRYRNIRAKYDAAQTNDENRNHWANSDGLSSREANSHGVRDILRRRSRYEVANNCHARGITLTLANDIVGAGVKLQCLLPSEESNDAIEKAWSEWADSVFLAEKLHTFVLSTIVNGESFMLLTNNQQSTSSVQLDIRLVECDRFSSPFGFPVSNNAVDGIEFDDVGNPIAYHMLKHHPGDSAFARVMDGSQVVRYPASQVIHWFRADRDEQVRGIPELTPALPIFSQLRRYTLAVLMAAEIAADFAAFIHTDAEPDAEESPSPFSTTDIDKGMITALPKNYKVTQLEPAQPTATHDTFTKTLLREACHCLNIPYNIATADFSGDSYAGGRMAQGVYQRFVEVRRKHFELRVLNRIFAAWLDEATKIPKLIPANIPASALSVPHTWFYAEWPHVDPKKEADAVRTELLAGTTTLAIEYAKKGLDWRKQLPNRGAEFQMMRDTNSLVLPPGTPALDGTGLVGMNKVQPNQDTHSSSGDSNSQEVDNAA